MSRPLPEAANRAANETWPQPQSMEHYFTAGQESPPPLLTTPQEGQPELLPAPQGSVGAENGKLMLPAEDAPDFTQHLVHPWFDEPWFSHGDPNDPHRHTGIVQPLMGTRWRNRPLFFGTFVC